MSLGSSKRLQLPSNTRWFSKWTLINCIKTNESCLKNAIWHQKITNKAKSDKNFEKQVKHLQEIICQSPDFWKHVDSIEKILVPLADAILKIEGSIVDVRKSYEFVDAAFQQSLTVSKQFKADQMNAFKQVNFK